MTFGENDSIDLSGMEAPEAASLPYLPDPEPDPAPAQDAPAPDDQPADDVPDEPAPEPEPAPATPPPANDMAANIAAMVEMQRRNMEMQAQQNEFARRQQEEAARPKPLMEQPEWRAKLNDAMERMGYDDDAKSTFIQLNSELAREQARAELAPMQQQMQMDARGEAVLRQTVSSVREQYGDMVPEQMFTDTANKLFNGNRAAIAQALDPSNPQSAETRQYIADLVVGRRYREGALRAPTPAKPPPNPRGAARSANPAPAAAPKDAWADDAYMDGVLMDALSGKRRNK